MERALHYLRDVHAPHIFPVAGPPCFLDDDLFAFNDLDGDPTNIFPDQTVFLDVLEARGDRRRRAARARAPSRRSSTAGARVEQPAGATCAGRDLRRQARRRSSATATTGRDVARGRARVVAARRPIDVVARARASGGSRLLDVAPLTRAGVGGAVLLHLGDVGVLIDFPDGTVREWSGEPVVLPDRHRPRARASRASSATSRTG